MKASMCFLRHTWTQVTWQLNTQKEDCLPHTLSLRRPGFVHVTLTDRRQEAQHHPSHLQTMNYFIAELSGEKVLSTLFHIHDLTDGHDWLIVTVIDRRESNTLSQLDTMTSFVLLDSQPVASTQDSTFSLPIFGRKLFWLHTCTILVYAAYTVIHWINGSTCYSVFLPPSSWW